MITTKQANLRRAILGVVRAEPRKWKLDDIAQRLPWASKEAIGTEVRALAQQPAVTHVEWNGGKGRGSHYSAK